jgi:predicted transposase/invertase (TIGR01784 family)
LLSLVLKLKSDRHFTDMVCQSKDIMRTDTIFYQLFLTFHSLLFELLGEPTDSAAHYQFISAEIKEKAFRFDGIFMSDREDQPLYFVEVQFQNKPDFYWEFISEINLYLNQYKPVQDWKAIALFAGCIPVRNEHKYLKEGSD